MRWDDLALDAPARERIAGICEGWAADAWRRRRYREARAWMIRARRILALAAADWRRRGGLPAERRLPPLGPPLDPLLRARLALAQARAETNERLAALLVGSDPAAAADHYARYQEALREAGALARRLEAS